MASIDFDPEDYLDEVSEEDFTMRAEEVGQALLNASELLRKHGSVRDIAAAHKLDIIRNERF